MSEKRTKKERFQLLELFPKATGDVAVRVGTVSRKIKYVNSLIHPIQGLGWYALVEELFIHNQSEQLLDMCDFLKKSNNLGQKLLLTQQEQINSTIKWLEEIVQVCSDSYSMDEKSFNSIYIKLFYTRVFKEYADDLAQLNPPNQQPFYIEDAMSQISRLFIKKEFTQRSQDNQLDPEQRKQLIINYLLLIGDDNFEKNDEYLTGIDTNRVIALSSFYDMNLRVYQEVIGEINIFTKQNCPSPDRMNLGLGFIFCNIDSYCIAYDSTLEVQFCLFSHYRQRKQWMVNNQLRLQEEIQGEKEQKNQQILQERAQFQEKISQLSQQFNKNQADLLVEQQNQIDLERKCDGQEQELNKFQQSEYLLEQEIRKKSIQRNNQFQATQAYYSIENNFQLQYKTELQIKKQAFQNEQQLLEKKQRQYVEYINKNKDTLEQSNINNFQGKYAQHINYYQQKCVMPNVQNKFECGVCCEQKNSSDAIVMSCCGFKICTSCMKQFFENNLKSLESLKCLNCQKPFRDLVSFYLQGFLSDQDLRKLTEKISYSCPYCKTYFQLKGSNSLGGNLLTPCCGREICRYCQQMKHKQGDVCQQQIGEYIKIIRRNIEFANIDLQTLQINPNNLSEDALKMKKKELEKVKRFRFCPDCQTLLIKDEHCEKLNCTMCKLEICFTCAAPRQPSVIHTSGCYHREGCEYHENENPMNPRRMRPDCTFCQKKGSVCDIPASWQQYQQNVRSWYGDAFFTQEFAYNWQIK